MQNHLMQGTFVMKTLNTIAVEQFQDRARIAIKSNQKNLSMTIAEVAALQDSLMYVMTRLAVLQDAYLSNAMPASNDVTVSMDGGGFK